jgi:hypothetical protein
METIEITEEQRRQNQVAFAEFMLERKRQAQQEIRDDINRPEIQAMIARLRKINGTDKK